MRQVPQYLLIGNGRTAHHFRHYFSLLQISFQTWHRNEPLQNLQKKVSQATHILILINDQAIEPFIKKHLQKSEALLIHFSGSLITQLGYGAHPLFCFNNQLYSLSQYQKIPFIVDADAPPFEK